MKPPFQPGRRARSLLRGCALVAIALVVGIGSFELSRAFSHADEKLSLDGVSNFGRVSSRLYRGAQPTDEGFAALRALGIQTVVRLSTGEEGSATEAHLVHGLGMQFVNLPWSTQHDPEPDQVETFLRLLRDHPAMKVFVHCKAGADRTGVMIAVSRIALDRWTVADALDEMEAFHYHPLFLPHLERYVEAFPAMLSSDPTLHAIVSPSSGF